MSFMIRPQQQRVREYLEERRKADCPPPTPDEIRRQLGWGLIVVERVVEGGLVIADEFR